MQLSAHQRKTLEQYQSFRDSPPTVGGLMARSARSHLLLVLFFTIGILLTLAVKIPSVSLILVGMAIGAISRDFGIFRKTVRFWPAFSSVLDWKHIEDLLADDQNG